MKTFLLWWFMSTITIPNKGTATHYTNMSEDSYYVLAENLNKRGIDATVWYDDGDLPYVLIKTK